MFTGAGFTSTLCNPLNVLYFLGADLTVDFEVSKLHSVMFITGPPTKKQGIIEPDCTQKSFVAFRLQVVSFPTTAGCQLHTVRRLCLVFGLFQNDGVVFV